MKWMPEAPTQAIRQVTLEVTACDRYGRCTTALPELGLVDPLPAAGAEVLAPPSGTVLTSTEPISISGDVYADNGLRCAANFE